VAWGRFKRAPIARRERDGITRLHLEAGRSHGTQKAFTCVPRDGPATNIEVLELSHAHLEEQHEFPEGMFVTTGKDQRAGDGNAIAVSAGGMLIVPPHTVHTVMPASEGRSSSSTDHDQVVAWGRALKTVARTVNHAERRLRESNADDLRRSSMTSDRTISSPE